VHPAYSIIVFSVASGAGFGLLAWLALLGLLGVIPAERALAGAGFGLAWALLTVGLVASTLHLGRPERAWRGLSQWRTSWLSREAVLALASYPASGLLALGWVLRERIDGVLALPALLTLACAVATLCATGMIYASLRTIRQWYQPLTMPIYVVLGLGSGAVLLHLLLVICGIVLPAVSGLCIALILAAVGLKWAYWMRIDGESRTLRAEAATGLGRLGKVRVLEAPHTLPNFVMREMGFAVARRHAVMLRKIALTSGFVVPLVALLATLRGGPLAMLCGALVAALATGAGLMVERWLFFAEAEHVAMLFYGRGAA
jgi:DMSO reductase anchor subunit